jgi:hypothetical protein
MTQAELKQAEAVKNADETEKLRLSDHDDHEDGHEHDHALNWREISRVLFVAAAAAAIWFLGGARNPYVIGIGVICTLVGGFPIFHEAYENRAARSLLVAAERAFWLRDLIDHSVRSRMFCHAHTIWSKGRACLPSRCASASMVAAKPSQ